MRVASLVALCTNSLPFPAPSLAEYSAGTLVLDLAGTRLDLAGTLVLDLAGTRLDLAGTLGLDLAGTRLDLAGTLGLDLAGTGLDPPESCSAGLASRAADGRRQTAHPRQRSICGLGTSFSCRALNQRSCCPTSSPLLIIIITTAGAWCLQIVGVRSSLYCALPEVCLH